MCVVDAILSFRAGRMAAAVAPLLPAGGRILDIGSGTGHTARCLRDRGLAVTEADVVDMHLVGPGPDPMADGALPYRTGQFDCGLLLFVLQYPSNPEGLLQRAAEVCCGRLVVWQSTFEGPWGRRILRLREWSTGRLAFSWARAVGLVNCPDPLHPRRLFSPEELARLFARCALAPAHWERRRWPILSISRDLFLLRVG